MKTWRELDLQSFSTMSWLRACDEKLEAIQSWLLEARHNDFGALSLETLPFQLVFEPREGLRHVST